LTPWSVTVEDLGYSQTKIAAMLEAFGGVPPEPTVPAAPVSPTPPEEPVAA
jgi:hypothetical protein